MLFLLGVTLQVVIVGKLNIWRLTLYQQIHSIDML